MTKKSTSKTIEPKPTVFQFNKPNQSPFSNNKNNINFRPTGRFQTINRSRR